MVPYVAGAASQGLVRAGESEVRKARVVEARDLPEIGSVTRFAGSGKSRGAVIEDAVLLKLAGVATEALSAESDVLPDGCARVAGIARKSGVRTNQREAIPVVLDSPRVYAPSLHRMAVLALRAELALVEICMAIRAAGAGFGKDFRYVARITRDILMHATKLEMGFRIVIEFEPRPKGRPTRSGVTLLTWDRKLPMRVRNIDLCYHWQRHP